MRKNYAAVATDECSNLLASMENNQCHDDDEDFEHPKMENGAVKLRISAEHCHAQLLSRNQDKSAEKLLWTVSAISLLHISAQLIGGILANSLAIISDSWHTFTDLASFLISIYMIRTAKSNANSRYTFGYLRAEYIGALASIFIIWTITITMIIFATQRIMEGDISVNTDIMLLTSLIGIAFNLVMVLLLKCSKNAPELRHGHSHFGHGHHDTNVNVRAALIHVLGDFFQSIGVLTAALVIRFTHFEMADPLCTYLFSLIVFCTSVPVARDVFLALMETTPHHLKYGQIKTDLGELELVQSVHSLHIWSLSTEQSAVSVHLVIGDEANAIQVTKAASSLLQNKYHFHFSTVQVELDAPIPLQV